MAARIRVASESASDGSTSWAAKKWARAAPIERKRHGTPRPAILSGLSSRATVATGQPSTHPCFEFPLFALYSRCCTFHIGRAHVRPATPPSSGSWSVSPCSAC